MSKVVAFLSLFCGLVVLAVKEIVITQLTIIFPAACWPFIEEWRLEDVYQHLPTRDLFPWQG